MKTMRLEKGGNWGPVERSNGGSGRTLNFRPHPYQTLFRLSKLLFYNGFTTPVFIFFSPRSKDGSIGNIFKAFTTVRKAAGLHTRKVFKDFHSLRHTSTTEVAKGVKNVIELQQFTRHESLTALKRYLHLFDNRREIAELANFKIHTGVTTGVTSN